MSFGLILYTVNFLANDAAKTLWFIRRAAIMVQIIARCGLRKGTCGWIWKLHDYHQSSSEEHWRAQGSCRAVVGYHQYLVLARCLGARFAESDVLSEHVSCTSLREFFQNYVCETMEDIEILTRAFILSLLGSSFLSSVDNTFNLGLLRVLEDIDATHLYDWGGASLETLYEYIGSVAHGLITHTGGFYHI